MLVLGRKENESILIGDNIRITVVGRSGASIRIGVQAPKSVHVVREELLHGALVRGETGSDEVRCTEPPAAPEIAGVLPLDARAAS